MGAPGSAVRPLQERGAAVPVTALGRPVVSAGAVAVVSLVVDQLTKSWAVRELADRDVDLVWTLRLHLTFNKGGAFSLGTGSTWFFVVAAVAVIAAMLVFGRRLLETSVLAGVSLGLVLGGAVGNLVDRLVRDHDGAVVDFVDLQWWPVFNVADACIVVGGLLLVLAGQRDEADA